MIKLNFEPKVDEKKAKDILKEIEKDKMGGWFDLPLKYDMGELVRIKEAAKKIRDESEILVCIGIGGSYLGHRAIIEALRPKSGVKIVYAGNSLSRRELEYALETVVIGTFLLMSSQSLGQLWSRRWHLMSLKRS